MCEKMLQFTENKLDDSKTTIAINLDLNVT